MSAPANAVPSSALDAQANVSGVTRPFYWSVRRELWEHGSLYIAPLAVAALGLVAFFFSLVHLPGTMHVSVTLDAGHEHMSLVMPYGHVDLLLILTTVLVGIFYSLDALHAERSDRSILFWKSLPVSDLTTVLAKASIPLLFLPLLVFAINFTLQLLMLLLSATVVLFSGASVASLWRQLPLFQIQVTVLYALAVLSLWYAPIYGWLLLVSGWARRATFLWAVLPPLAIGVFERIAFHTTYFFTLMRNRFIGFAWDAFNLRLPNGALVDPHFIPLSQATPGRFLSTPGLWIGLAVAAAFLGLAVRLRHYREPV